MSAQKKVLVTGASGYIALHVIDQLLKEGHKVRGTVRSLKDAKKVNIIKNLAKNPDQLELVEADLENVESWKDAIKGMEVVIHMASPFPLAQPEDEQSVIKPAVEGTLSVLRACVGTTVKRVVVTSSGYAIFGEVLEDKTYSENDWPDINRQQTAYCKSKILAEKAAWDFVEEKKKNNESIFELSVVNPTLVLGPILSNIYGTSAEYFLSVFQNKTNFVANMSIPCCDVRNVAEAHLKAAFLPETANNRHIVITGNEFIPLKTWAEILLKEFSSKGLKIPTECETEVVNTKSKLSDSRMREVLGIKPIDIKTTLVDMANSFIEFGLVKLE